MHPIVFRLGDGDDARYYELPPENFLFPEVGEDKESCHLGIVGQQFANMDYWLLGDAFLSAFYTVFDAHSAKPRVGLAVEKNSFGAVKVTDSSETIKLLIVAVLIVGSLVLCSFTLVSFRIQQRQKHA